MRERMISLFLVGVCLLGASCSRAYYRRSADSEVYDILGERMFDPRWLIPSRPVEPSSDSRMALIADPDQGPLPPDDPAAHRYMHVADGHPGSRLWNKRGALHEMEGLLWLESLPRDERGNLSLDRESAVQIALLNSRAYQDAVESMYLSALFLTLERFEFDTRWAAGTGVDYFHTGTGGQPTESNRLTVGNGIALRRNFTAGGQLLVDFANTFAWEFTGKDVSFASSGLLVSLTQPLLRGASRAVRMEGLTQSEREVLYRVRLFARFRREFYVEVTRGYLGLLQQVQGIRNTESNLASLTRNLEEHRELARAGMVAPIQVDQVFQQYQQGRLSLLQSEASLESSIDVYNIELGLPPQIPVRLDDSLLRPFELNDPRLTELSNRTDALTLRLVQTEEAPPRVELSDIFERLLEQQNELAELISLVEEELHRWRGQLDARSDATSNQKSSITPQLVAADSPPAVEAPTPRTSSRRQAALDPAAQAEELNLPVQEDVPNPGGPLVDESAIELDRQRRLADDLEFVLRDVRTTLAEDQKDTRSAQAQLGQIGDLELTNLLYNLLANRFRERLADTFVAETQIRVYLIELPPLDFTEYEAIQIALNNRLDLMNERARAVDAWRHVEVAANALRSDLDVRVDANLATDPDTPNPLKFTPRENTYRVGMSLDGPIQRVSERNAYRASQLAFQQARRRFLLAEDGVRRSIRSHLRNLEANRLQFQIARQQLVTAARQVDQAQVSVRNAREADSSVTQDLLGALQTLLGARNNLINTWVDYQILRMNLYRDMDIMEIDGNGKWVNEHAQATDLGTVLGDSGFAEGELVFPLESLPEPD